VLVQELTAGDRPGGRHSQRRPEPRSRHRRRAASPFAGQNGSALVPPRQVGRHGLRSPGPWWWPTRRAFACDVVLALFVAGYAAVGWVILRPEVLAVDPQAPAVHAHGALDVLRGVAGVLAGLSLVLRRRLLVAVVVAGVVDLWFSSGLSYPLALYAVIVAGRRRWTAAAVLAGVGAAFADLPWMLGITKSGFFMSGPRPPVAVWLDDVVWGDLLPTLMAPVLVAVMVCTYRRVVGGLGSYAERLRQENALTARNARLEERAAIARDMHDVVAHHVGLMVLQASVLEIGAGDRAEVSERGRLLGELGRQALSELRELLGVLGDDEDEGSGEGTGAANGLGGSGRASGGADRAGAGAGDWLADLRALVERSRRAGMAADLDVHGQPGPAFAAAGRAAYRLVQEGLANAHKHAPGAPVGVTVTVSGEGMQVTVVNAAAEHATAPVGLPGSGRGLTGMRRRVAAAGGTFLAGPVPGGGFRLLATFPLLRAVS
jgi:signal transduction histidine kinase